MRIVVSAQDARGLASEVDSHFGRCPFFAIVDVNGSEVIAVEAVENPFYGQHQPGQVPAFIRGLGADAMVTGGMGGRAVELFQGYGIEAVTGAGGTVQEALAAYLDGRLAGAGPCREGAGH